MKKTIICFIVVIIFIGTLFVIFDKKDNKKIKKEEVKTQEAVYNKYVITLDNAKLYSKGEKFFEEIGSIKKDEVLILENIKVGNYFKIEGLDYYINYNYIKKYEEEYSVNDDYLNYIPFNEKIITSETKLYNDQNELVYNIKDSLEFVPLIKDDNKKYVVFNNELLHILDTDIKETIKTNIELEEKAKEITVFTYHFFYDGTEENKCDQIICLSQSKFEEQLTYLKNNNYYTLTMKEFEYFLDKKINLPKKSVLITVDDGWMGTKTVLPRMLEKYDMKASLFLITGSFYYKNYQFKNLELHSHSNAMHTVGACNMGLQGGGILCLPENKVLEDLQITRDLLNTRAFAYPFYDYNDRAKRLLKEAGFTMAFVGKNRKAYPGIDKYEIPRYAILSYMTMDDFIRKLG